MSQPRLKIGLALSGASSRSVFYIGFLEVLQENDIPIDYIAACSGATIIAASFACGTLPQFKEYLFNLKADLILSLVERKGAKGGIYNLDKVEQVFREFTRGQSFEEARPHMGFVAVDIDRGEQVVLSMGDLAHAARVSCTVPGIFEPVQWGSRTLVDGGLLSVVPCDVVRKAGVDIVIGINIKSSNHIFLPHQVRLRKWFNATKKMLTVNYASRLWQTMARAFEQMDIFDYFEKVSLENDDLSDRPGMFSVLGRSLDLAIAAQNNSTLKQEAKDCDILIRYELKNGRKSYEIRRMKETYLEGREVALKYLPQLQKIINEKS